MKAWRWIALTAIAGGAACGANAEPTAQANPESMVEDDSFMGSQCGGPDNVACPSGNFCASTTTNRCPGIEVYGVCRRIPEACGYVYLPICGCDDQTYGNECQAAALGVPVAYKGPCGPMCGGFAGFACPGAGTCANHATDECDTTKGDRDCLGLCRCDVAELCNDGWLWDSSPQVCACVGE